MTELEKRMLALLKHIANDPSGHSTWRTEVELLKSILEKLEAMKLGTPPDR